MNPTNFKQQNFTFTKPSDMTAEECNDLPVFKGTDGKYPVIISAWKSTPEELKEINETGIVWLTIVSNGMPPVSLSGHDPFPKEKFPEFPQEPKTNIQ